MDLSTSILTTPAATAVATFNVLDSVGSRTKALLPTNGATNIERTVHLHMHVEFILIIEGSEALVAFILVLLVLIPLVAFYTVSATRVSISLHPLISAKAAAAFPFGTLGTATAHVEKKVWMSWESISFTARKKEERSGKIQ